MSDTKPKHSSLVVRVDAYLHDDGTFGRYTDIVPRSHARDVDVREVEAHLVRAAITDLQKYLAEIEPEE